MQIKTIVSCHSMLTRMAIIKKQIMRILAKMWTNWNIYTLLVVTEKCNCFVKQSQKIKWSYVTILHVIIQ